MSKVEFGSLFLFMRNGMNIKQDKSGDGLPISRIETIAASAVDPDRVGYAGLEEAECRDWLLKAGDILFSHINSVEHVGKCAVYRGIPEKLVHGMNLLCLRPDPTRLDPEFGKYLIRSPSFRASLSNFINKAVNQASVSIGNLRTIPVPLPPLPEQRRIAAILDQADTLRTQRRAALAQLDSLTQSLFLDMFGDPATNPKGWELKTIGELCEVKGGKRLPKGAEYSSTPTQYRYIRVTNLSNGKVDESALLHLTPEVQRSIARYVVAKGDVIISIAGSIGLIAPVPASLHGANLTENAAKLVARRAGDYLPDFLAFMLSTKSVQDQIGSHVGQVTIGKLALFRIEKLVVPVPPLPLQQTFATRVQAIEALKTQHRAALAEADALFASLQQRAFAGRL